MNSYIKTFLLSDTEQFQNDIRLTLRVFFFFTVISDHFPVSFLTLYLGVMCAIFLITTLLHPYDFTCLLNGLSYLFCLPSAYVLLYIYSIINIIDSSWGK